MRALALAACLMAAPLAAQEAVNPGTGAVLRTLDKLNAKVEDVTLTNGQAAVLGQIEVALQECRFPVGNPAGDAYAFLTIRQAGVAEPLFRGWMVASSPALNPLDHPRYDVWVLRCTTS
ncbi:DUF2155 domain-containing protein [Thetidibacter halocola]|uniref:DUF2155 domain-containing protein n=1 Tax=Thetidibacter halocola TaxID=2827239 RepID=A0A8J8B9A5_9RHOB|nr:DUF2155 domain-containing protein [Thetidibacter halocola]MBS0125355.1 DUF2155 domain-containing protein [Thetidibacter halocola]